MSSQSIFFPGVSLRESSYSQPHSNSFKNMLSGDMAFYNQTDYLDSTRRDFVQPKPLLVNYRWNSESSIRRIAKQVFSIIVFPVQTYKLLHSFAGKVALLPSATPTLLGYSKNYANYARSNISLNNMWKYKRITVEVDGYKIDAMIVGKASTLNNGRWVLASNGNGEFYEDKLSCNNDFRRILSEIKSNGIVFNYPGVGASSGLPSREAMAKAYRAMLNLLEDQKNGIGAKEIIGYGHSIGGGVQGDALKNHDLKKDVKYVFVKSRTFSDLSTTASTLTIKPLGFLVKILGWNMNNVKSSKQLQAPEIIMQTAAVEKCEQLSDSLKIIDDGIISAKASLAKALLDDNNFINQNKVFIGMEECHNERLSNPLFLAQTIERLLKI